MLVFVTSPLIVDAQPTNVIYSAVLAQLYYFKPQTLTVSQSFLVIVVYFVGKAWEKIVPSRGIFRYLNPGPFNIKELVNIQS